MWYRPASCPVTTRADARVITFFRAALSRTLARPEHLNVDLVRPPAPGSGGGRAGAGEQGRLACQLQLAKTLRCPSGRHQGVPEAYPDDALQAWVQVGAEQRTAGCFGVGDPPGPHEAAGLFGEQASTAGVPAWHQPSRPAQQIRGDIG